MTTNEQTTQAPAWLEQIAPAAARAEARHLAAVIDEHRQAIGTKLERAREMLAQFEERGNEAAEPLGDKGSAVAELLAEVSGSQELFNALADLGEACDPTTHPVYAALASPGQLRMDRPIVMRNPAGEEVQVCIWSTHCLGEDQSVEVFEAGAPGGARWLVSRAELARGARRGMAPTLSALEPDEASPNGERLDERGAPEATS